MNYFRYLGTIGAFILFVIAIKFFNDGNMYWWLFMFAFIIVSGFLVGEENIEDEQVEAMLKPRWYDNAHCMECGYVNKACVCKPVSNISNNDYKATYDNSGHDDSKISTIDMYEVFESGPLEEDGTRTKTSYLRTHSINCDADIMNNDGLSEWEVTKSEEAEAADERLRNEMKILNVTDWNHVTDGDVEDFDDEGNPINTVY